MAHHKAQPKPHRKLVRETSRSKRNSSCSMAGESLSRRARNYPFTATSAGEVKNQTRRAVLQLKEELRVTRSKLPHFH